jgi:mannose-6-phosphate isomerase-like protein (cupin superfamily)
MNIFDTKRLPVERDDIAPDGSDVRVLLNLDKGGLAHFEIGPHKTSVAVAHRTVEEIWYFLGGKGRCGESSIIKRKLFTSRPAFALRFL